MKKALNLKSHGEKFMGGFRGNKEKEEMLWLNYNLRNRNNNDNKEKRKLSTGCACVYSLTAMECDVTNCFKLLSSFPHNNDITQENKRQRNTFYTWLFFFVKIYLYWQQMWQKKHFWQKVSSSSGKWSIWKFITYQHDNNKGLIRA